MTDSCDNQIMIMLVVSGIFFFPLCRFVFAASRPSITYFNHYQNLFTHHRRFLCYPSKTYSDFLPIFNSFLKSLTSNIFIQLLTCYNFSSVFEHSSKIPFGWDEFFNILSLLTINLGLRISIFNLTINFLKESIGMSIKWLQAFKNR